MDKIKNKVRDISWIRANAIEGAFGYIDCARCGFELAGYPDSCPKCGALFLDKPKKLFEHVKLGYLSTPLYGKVHFEPYKYQCKILNTINKWGMVSPSNVSVIMSSRQMGVTTSLCAYAHFKACYDEHRRVLFISLTNSQGHTKLDIIRRFLYGFNTKTTPYPIINRQAKIQLINGSIIQCKTARSLQALNEVGECHDILIDDAIFMPNIDLVCEQVVKLFPNANIVIASTGIPKKRKQVRKLKDGLNVLLDNCIGMDFIRLPWYLHPDRDASWKINREITIGIENFKYEHLCDLNMY